MTERTARDYRRDILFARLPPDRPAKATQQIRVLSRADQEVLRWLQYHRTCREVIFQAPGDLRAVACEHDGWSRLCCFLDDVEPLDLSIRTRGSIAS